MIEFVDNTNLSLYRGAAGAGDIKAQAIQQQAQMGSSEFEKQRAALEVDTALAALSPALAQASSAAASAQAAQAALASMTAAPLAAALPLLLNDKQLTLDTCSVAARVLSDPVCQPVSALEVKNSSIGSTEVDVLCSAIASNPVTTLRSLNLSDNQLIGPRATDTNGWRALGAMLATPHCKIEELILNNCKIDDAAVDILAKTILQESKTGRLMAPLRRVCIDRNELSSRGLTVLTDLFVANGCLVGRSHLVHFSASKNNINDDGAVYLVQKLLQPPQLPLSDKLNGAAPQPPPASPADGAAVAGVVTGSLLHIDFHDNLIGDGGASAIAKTVVALGESCALLSLDLSSNPKMTASSGAALSHMVSRSVGGGRYVCATNPRQLILITLCFILSCCLGSAE